MNTKSLLGVVFGITFITTLGATTPVFQHHSEGFVIGGLTGREEPKAPPSITGENVYVAWWTNKTANNNEEIMFRASTDGGATFGDKINLSNTMNADSWKAEIDSDAGSVVVTWWETNQTSDTPVMRVSANSGQTFGPMLRLATNGTIGEAGTEEEGTEEGE
jgi:hypothetical protein